MADIRLNNGRIPRLLDIITVPVLEPAPHPYQNENFLIANSHGWIMNDILPVTSTSGLCDNVDSLWDDEHPDCKGLNDRIPEYVAEQTINSSLYFIKPQNFYINVSEEDGRKKVRGKFIYKNVSYLLAITDPDIEREYIVKEVGQYLIPTEELYLTISLGEPFNGFCYKLITGIISGRDLLY